MTSLARIVPQRSVLGALEQGLRIRQLTDAEYQVVGRQLALGAVLGVAGYFVGRRYGHPVLGALGGLGAGSSAALFASGRPGEGAQVAVIEVAAVGAALAWPTHPAVGYVGGHVGANLLLGALVPAPAGGRPVT